MKYVSIAKDFFYETTASTLSYYVSYNGRILYSGVSVKPSSAENNVINISHRIADWLEIDMPDFSDYDGVVIPHPEQILDFELYSTDGTLLETFRALLGYYGEWDGSDVVQSEPINGRADFRQKIFWGSLNSEEKEIEIKYGIYDLDIIYAPDFVTYEEEDAVVFYETNCDGNVKYELYYKQDGNWVFSNSGTTYSLSAVTITVPQNMSDNEIEYKVVLSASLSSDEDTYVVFTEAKFTQSAYLPYLVFDVLSDGLIGYKKEVYSPYNLSYSKDSGSTWTVVTGSSFMVYTGDVVYVKREKLDPSDERGVSFSFAVTNDEEPAYYNVRGNIMSLYYGFNNPGYDFRSKFGTGIQYGNKPGVVDASKLILPNVNNYSGGTIAASIFLEMFADCDHLTAAPSLPSIDLSSAKYCYCWMFKNCTALEKAPLLPATALSEYCYDYMFSGCTSLNDVQKTLPAMSVPKGAYNWMFYGCSSLEKIPKLPAKSIGNQSYASMFSGTSVKKAVDIPVDAVMSGTANCSSMYSECTSLKDANITLPTGLTENCFQGMFSGCVSLNVPPALPSTVLAKGCYRNMFSRCSSLNVAPVLSAKTLVYDCYSNMLQQCSSLVEITCLAETNTNNNTIVSWTYGVAPTGTFYKKTGVSWSEGTSGIPNGWTVVEV